MPKYLSARKLGVSALTRKYLMYAARTLPLLSRPRKLNGGTFGFYMPNILNTSNSAKDFNGRSCGTAGCILGLMNYKAKLDGVPNHRRPEFRTDRLSDLYGPPDISMSEVTNAMAAKAVKRLLMTGKIYFKQP